MKTWQDEFDERAVIVEARLKSLGKFQPVLYFDNEMQKDLVKLKAFISALIKREKEAAVNADQLQRLKEAASKRMRFLGGPEGRWEIYDVEPEDQLKMMGNVDPKRVHHFSGPDQKWEIKKIEILPE